MFKIGCYSYLFISGLETFTDNNNSQKSCFFSSSQHSHYEDSQPPFFLFPPPPPPTPNSQLPTSHPRLLNPNHKLQTFTLHIPSHIPHTPPHPTVHPHVRLFPFPTLHMHISNLFAVINTSKPIQNPQQPRPTALKASTPKSALSPIPGSDAMETAFVLMSEQVGWRWLKRVRGGLVIMSRGWVCLGGRLVRKKERKKDRKNHDINACLQHEDSKQRHALGLDQEGGMRWPPKFGLFAIRLPY